MNKKGVFFVLLVFLLLLTNTAIFAQNSGNEQRLVGTWTSSSYDSRVTFNADGTMSGTSGFSFVTTDGNQGSFQPTHWAAAGDKIVVFIPNSYRALREFQISSDGRTLILINHMDVYGMIFGSTASPFRRN